MTAFASANGRWKIEQYQSNFMASCGTSRFYIAVWKDGIWQSYRDESTFNSALKFLRDRLYISEDEYRRNLKVRG